MKGKEFFEQFKNPLIPLGALGVLGLGLSFFCNPSKIQEFLLHQITHIFSDLLNYSNEREEAARLLDSIPDGEERSVAGLINGAYQVNLSRIQRGKIKPHHVILDALRAAEGIYSSGRRPRDR